MKPINWRLAATTVIVGASLFAAVAAWAGDTTIRIDTVIRNPDPGSVHVVHDPITVGDDGEVCAVTISPSNNVSIHDGNDFIVRSGASEVVAFDMERAGPVPDTTGTLTLDGPAEFLVRLSETFSAGVTVRFQCQLPTTTTRATTTTTTRATTTTSTSPPTSSTTSTSRPATTTTTRITTTTAPVTTTSSSTSTTTNPPESTTTTLVGPPTTSSCPTLSQTTLTSCCCCFPAPAQNPTDGGGEPPWIWPLTTLIAGVSVMGAAAIHGRMRR